LHRDTRKIFLMIDALIVMETTTSFSSAMKGWIAMIKSLLYLFHQEATNQGGAGVKIWEKYLVENMSFVSTENLCQITPADLVVLFDSLDPKDQNDCVKPILAFAMSKWDIRFAFPVEDYELYVFHPYLRCDALLQVYDQGGDNSRLFFDNCLFWIAWGDCAKECSCTTLLQLVGFCVFGVDIHTEARIPQGFRTVFKYVSMDKHLKLFIYNKSSPSGALPRDPIS